MTIGDDKRDLKNRLLNSEAANTLLFEREIARLLEPQYWDVTYNPYYRDKETKKFRELDVFGRMLRSGNNELYYDLQLLIECKSLTNYHIIFSNKTKFYTSDYDTIWLGDDIKYSRKLKRVLTKIGFSKIEEDGLINKITSHYYPKNSWVFSGENQPSPFGSIDCFKSFRETNIGGVKELDSSVIWKSFMSLKSINRSIKERAWNNLKEDLQFYFEDGYQKESAAEIAFDAIEHKLNGIDIIYPIVVIEAEMWELTEMNNLEAIKYCRLMQSDLYGIAEFWIDVVSRRFFEEYINKLSIHFQNAFNKIAVNK